MTTFLRALLLLLVPAAVGAQQNIAVLAGPVVDNDRAPVPGAPLVLDAGATRQPAFAAVTGADGRFLLRGVPPASYKLRISFPGHQPSEADVVVSELNRAYELGEIRLTPLERFAETVTVAGTPVHAAGV